MGVPAVLALFARRPAEVERLFLDARAAPALGEACAELARTRRPYRLVDADELAKVAGTVLHGGAVAVARARPVLPFDPEEAEGWRGPLLVLDGIGNPHNLGAVVRTAAFFGIERVVVSDHPAQALPSEAAYRVAEGGFEAVSLHRAERLPAALRRLAASHRVVGTALEGGAPLDARGLSDPGGRPVAIVLGNEETGLPKATLEACGEVAFLPGSGAVQSLNVAATAAILIHAAALPSLARPAAPPLASSPAPPPGGRRRGLAGKAG